MGKEGKKSLEELYLIQAKLREATNNLLKKLQDTNRDSEVDIKNNFIKVGEYSWQDVKGALRWIEWKKGESLKFRVRYLDEDEKVIYKPHNEEENPFGWGIWEKNPFRIFFESEALYKDAMEKIEVAENLLKGFLAGQNMMETIDKTKVLDSDALKRIGDQESIFRAAVSEAILDLEMQVASKLVEWIQPKLLEESA